MAYLGRDRVLVLMVSKKPDGTCMYQDFKVQQQALEVGYGLPKKAAIGSQTTVDCGGS